MDIIFTDKQNYYALLQTPSGELVLDVLSGGIAMFSVIHTLTEAERKRYGIEGKTYLDDLARLIARYPEKYKD